MNELVFVSNRYNVVSAQFMRQGKASGTIYSWYLPYDIQKHLHIDDVVFVNADKKRVEIQSLSYDVDALGKYKEFPYRSGRPSWQIQHICRHLTTLGYKYQRERHFKRLKNRSGVSLGVDIAFQVDDRWCFIEYNGVHHYYRDSPRYANTVANMQDKRQWCRENDIPILEIPFWWQNDLDVFVDCFLKVVAQEGQKRLTN